MPPADDSAASDGALEPLRENDFAAALRPHTTGDVAMNFLTDDEGAARVQAAYGDNYDRLAPVKAEWDPGKLFRTTQNVEPRG